MALMLIVAFSIAALICYVLLSAYAERVANRWTESCSEITSDLDAMFVKNSGVLSKRIKVSFAVFFVLLGFAFPNSLVSLDRVILDNAARLNKQGLYDQAILFMSGLARNRSPMLHNELGVAYLGVNDLEAAISNLETSIQLLPEYGQAHANLSVAYTLAEQHTDAMFEAQRAESYLRYEVDEELIYGKESSLQASLFLRLLFAALFLLVGLKLPLMLTGFFRKRREARYERELADALKIMGNSLKAGMSLEQAIEMMVEQSTGPVKQEFNLVLKEYFLGRSIEEALVSLRERLPTDDNVMLIDTVALLTETGGNIPEAIQNVIYSISERQRVKNKISAMTAEGRAQTVILALIPVAIGLVMNTMQKEMFSLMYTTVLGWIFLIIMVVWGAMGIYLMTKIVNVKI